MIFAGSVEEENVVGLDVVDVVDVEVPVVWNPSLPLDKEKYKTIPNNRTKIINNMFACFISVYCIW